MVDTLLIAEALHAFVACCPDCIDPGLRAYRRAVSTGGGDLCLRFRARDGPQLRWLAGRLVAAARSGVSALSGSAGVARIFARGTAVLADDAGRRRRAGPEP